MNLPKFITFTGVDVETCPVKMLKLHGDYSGLVEFGLLFSPKLNGNHNRYPDLEVIEEIVSPFDDTINFSAHLCGDYAKTIINGGKLSINLEHFGRIQINTKLKINEKTLKTFKESINNTVLIPSRDSEYFPENIAEEINWLYDSSCGHGIRPKFWPKVCGNNIVGFAGGINPINVMDIINEIDCNTDYWLSIETGIRTDNDWFDLDKVRAVLEAVYGNPTYYWET
jgi:phosphoribosylanthranilate isomerase